jgi:hypothetical protein
MLRSFVLLLVFVNGVYFAWSHELLRGYGFGPLQTSEPQRLSQQIRPEALRILSSQEAQQEAAAAQVPGKPTSCWQAGLFDERQAAAVRQSLVSVIPQEAWSLSPATDSARWIVYMGKYPSAEALSKKRRELMALKVNVETVSNPKLEFGLSLGGFDTQAAAEAALATFNQKGVRTARVVLEQAQTTGFRLKFPTVDDALRARLTKLSPDWFNKPLQACASPG